MNEDYLSWGRYPKLEQRAKTPSWTDELPPSDPGTLLPRGNGRSYGDSCLVPSGGTLIDLRKLDRLLGFGQETGVLRCEAGVLLESIQRYGLKRGWCLPVSPGTGQVTVGGAIANDVHGKNHHRRGSFGNHVRAFELVRSNGERIVCSEASTPALFRATIGGLGLTGFMTWAEIELARVSSPMVKVDSMRFSGLDQFDALCAESDAGFEFTAAWIDCLAAAPRGVFIRANHVEVGATGTGTIAPRSRRVPFTSPISLVNRASLRLFNAIYFHRPMARGRVVPLVEHLCPLDAIADWNRLYGPRGFQQFQCVIPPQASRMATSEILQVIAASRTGSFLCVLKRFGEVPAKGLLSFSRPGWTLALDFPMEGRRTLELLAELDRIVLESGGVLYPAKDAHMSGDSFQRSYPQWQELEALRDPRITSVFWDRVTGASRCA